VCGVFTFSYTSAGAAGRTSYLQLTFSSATGGTFFVMSFDNTGALEDIDTGNFYDVTAFSFAAAKEFR